MCLMDRRADVRTRAVRAQNNNDVIDTLMSWHPDESLQRLQPASSTGQLGCSSWVARDICDSKPWMTLRCYKSAFCVGLSRFLRLAFGDNYAKTNEDTLILSAAKMFATALVSSDISSLLCGYLRGFSREAASTDSGMITTNNWPSVVKQIFRQAIRQIKSGKAPCL